MESIIFDWGASRSPEHRSLPLREELSWVWLTFPLWTRIWLWGNLKWQLLSRLIPSTFHASQERKPLLPQLPNRHQSLPHTCACLCTLNRYMNTAFVSWHEVLVDHMVGVVPALEIRLFVWELAFVQVIEEPVIRHDVVGIKGTAHRPVCTLIHR